MQKLEKRLEELMYVAKVHGLRKQAIRRHFGELDYIKQKQFIEEFQWEIIKTTNENNYQD